MNNTNLEINEISNTQNKISLPAFAKINLTLDVCGVLPNGYHSLQMVMQSIDIFDTITVSKNDTGKITVSMNRPLPDNLPPEKNIAHKVAMKMKEKYSLSEGFDIYIEKNIPAAAGLAGGSTDCATTLKAISKLCNLNLSNEELCEIGVTIGADVPFCVVGGTAFCEGIGEIITNLNSLKNIPLVLVKPKASVSTQGIYQAYDKVENVIHPDNKTMLSYIENFKTIEDCEPNSLNQISEDESDSRVQNENCDTNSLLENADNITKISSCLSNVLEYVTIPNNPIIDILKARLLELGAAGSLMSGSGPSTYGLFTSYEDAQNAYEVLKTEFPECEFFVTKTL